MSVRILGTGSYLPEKVVTNDDIARTLDTTDEWIYSHTGIRSRHIAAEGETTSTMAVEASRAALDAAGVAPGEIALVVVATSTPDFNPFPATACLVQDRLGCANAGAFDVQAACTGFITALEMARGFVAGRPGCKALVVGAETLSRILDWSDRGSCILFGDGAGAVVVGSDDAPDVAPSAVFGADGSGARFIARSGGVRDLPANPAARVSLMGHEVFAFAVRTLARVTEAVCKGVGTTPEALDRVFAHQANMRIIEATARRMKLPLARFYLNLETTANTSAASVPISLDRAVRAGELVDGMKIVMVGFGSGLTYGGSYSVWPQL